MGLAQKKIDSPINEPQQPILDTKAKKEPGYFTIFFSSWMIATFLGVAAMYWPIATGVLCGLLVVGSVGTVFQKQHSFRQKIHFGILGFAALLGLLISFSGGKKETVTSQDQKHTTAIEQQTIKSSEHNKLLNSEKINPVADQFTSEVSGKIWIIFDGNTNGVVIQSATKPPTDRTIGPEAWMKESDTRGYRTVNDPAPNSDPSTEKFSLLSEDDLSLIAQRQAEEQLPEYSGITDDKLRNSRIARKLNINTNKLKGLWIFSTTLEQGIEKGSLLDKRTGNTPLTADAYKNLLASMIHRTLSVKDIFMALQKKEADLRENHQQTAAYAVLNKMVMTPENANSWGKFSSNWNRELNGLRQNGIASARKEMPQLTALHNALDYYGQAIRDYWSAMDNQITNGKPIPRERVTELEARVANTKEAVEMQLKNVRGK